MTWRTHTQVVLEKEESITTVPDFLENRVPPENYK